MTLERSGDFKLIDSPRRNVIHRPETGATDQS